MKNRDNSTDGTTKPTIKNPIHQESCEKAGQILPQRPEAIIQTNEELLPENLWAMLPEEVRKTIYKLRMRQKELEFQNEELLRKQEEIDVLWANKVLQDSEESFRSLFMNAPIPYQALDEDGYFLDVNRAFLSALGYSEEELIGRNFSIILHLDWVEPFKDSFQKLKDIGEILGVEFKMIKKDGSSLIVSFSGMIQRNNQGTFQKTHCVFQDITEQKRAEAALRENERLFSESQKAAHIGSYETDLVSRTWKASTELYEIAGIDAAYPHTLEGWSGIIHPDYRENIYEYHLQVEAGRKRFDHEYKISRIDSGEERWVHGLGEIEYDHQLNPVRMIGTIQDITARKRVEEALRESEEIYRALFENTGTSMILIDEDMTIRMANEEFARNTGYSSDEINGHMKWTEIAHPNDRKRMIEQHQLRRQKQGAGMTEYEFQYITKTGDLRDTLLTIQLVPGTNTSVASHIDITDRKQAEKKLKNSEEKFRTLAESTPVAIMMHQGDRWIYANRAAMELSGYTEEELYEMLFWNLAHPDFRDFLKQTGWNRQKGMIVPREYEFKFITKNGIEKWGSLTGNPIQYEEKPTALITVTDITARKIAEDEKTKLEAQLQQAQKLESIGRLAGGVAHDFNNMLGVILGYTEIALINMDSAQPLYSTLSEIRKTAERSASLTRQLLAFACKQPIAPKILDLNETVAGMLNMLRRIIGENIYLDWQPEASLWLVVMDPSQIDQALANLCINARDAISGVGNIVIATENCCLDKSYGFNYAGRFSGDYVRLSVSDDGCGMDKETLGHIFEPFFTTKGVNRGTGLGLATVYGVVKQNNGFIFAISEPGQGTTITIYLPRYMGNGKQLLVKNPVELVLNGQETILVVEDEPAILEVTTTILEMQGYEVLVASNPGEAISLAMEQPGDLHLLLTDVIMPEMNGWDLSKRILSIYPNLKTLFMSGYTDNIIAHQGVLDERTHFIQKPFSLINLATKVREALDSE